MNSDGNQKKTSELSQEKPILQCCWGHPQFGSVLATAAFDGNVTINKETNNHAWEKVYVLKELKKTITFLSMNPFHSSKGNLQCLVGFADGELILISYINDSWMYVKEAAHSFGITSIAWLNSDTNSSISAFITSGNDYLLKYWEIHSTNHEDKLIEVEVLDKIHTGPITGIDIFVDEGNTLTKKDFMISFDSNDEIYSWKISKNQLQENNKKQFVFSEPQQVKFVDEQKPYGIMSVQISKCGEYLSICSQENTGIYKNISNEYILYSVIGNDGVKNMENVKK